MIRLSPIEDPLMQDMDRGRRRFSDIDRLTRFVTWYDIERDADVVDSLDATIVFGVVRSRLTATLLSSTMIGGSINKTPDSSKSEKNLVKKEIMVDRYTNKKLEFFIVLHSELSLKAKR